MRSYLALSLFPLILAVTVHAAEENSLGRRELAGRVLRGIVKLQAPVSFRFSSPGSEFMSVLTNAAQSDIHFRIRSGKGVTLAESLPSRGEYGVGVMSVLLRETDEYTLEADCRCEPEAAGYFEMEVTEWRIAEAKDAMRVAEEAQLLSVLATLDPSAVPRSEALNSARRYRASCSHGADDVCTARAAFVSGKILMALNSFEEAIRAFEETGAQTKKLPLSMRIGILNGEATAYFLSGKSERARELYRESVRVSRAFGSKYFEVEGLLLLAAIARERGDAQEELSLCRQALAIAEQGGFEIAAAQARVQLARRYDGSDPTGASENARLAAATFRRYGYRRGEAIAQGTLARVLYSVGDYGEALTAADASLTIHRETQNPDGQASVLPLMGALFQRLGDPDKAIVQYRKAFSTARAGDQAVQINLLLTMAELHVMQGNAQEARGEYEQAASRAHLLPSPRLEAMAEFGIGRSLSDPAVKGDHFRRALELCRRIADNRCAAEVLLQTLKLHEPSSALELAEEAKALFITSQDAIGEAMSELAAGTVLKKQGRLDDALPHLSRAVELAETQRAALRGPSLRMTYFSELRTFYDSVSDVLMLLHAERPGRGYDREALFVNEQSRARVLLDGLIETRRPKQTNSGESRSKEEQLRARIVKAASDPILALSGADRTELDSLLAEYTVMEANSAAQQQGAPTDIAVLKPDQIIRDVLDEDTAILEYRIGSEASYVWIISKSGVRGYTLPSSAVIDPLAQNVIEAQSSPDTTDADNQYRKAATALSEVIFRPVGQSLSVKKVFVVADGLLQKIAFAGLPLPHDNLGYDAVGQKAQVLQIPSASALAAMRKQVHRSTPVSKSVLVFADPAFATDSGRLSNGSERTSTPTWWRLQASRDEANAIARIAGKSRVRVLEGFEANVQALKSEDIGQYRIIHFATHARTDARRPDLSGIVLSDVDAKGARIDGMFRVLDIYRLHLSAELVVLSACRSADGRDTPGEGLVTLSRAFLYAGSPAVLAGLWDLNSRFAQRFMQEFYSNFLSGSNKSVAEALHATHRKMAEQGVSPRKWAAFVLLGE